MSKAAIGETLPRCRRTRALDEHVHSTRFPLASLLFTSLLFAGCQKSQPLPEQGTYAQQLYANRCGACHRPYSPASMTAAMWEVQVETMRAKIAQAGQPPLSPEQLLTILDYLKRNSGRQ
jgi:mono/diheme cytochrome c family protein